MAQARLFRATIGLVVTVLTLSLASPAQGIATSVQQKLSSQFKLTTIKPDRSDIVSAGDMVVIHKPGLVMYGVSSPMPPSNTYKNGKISQGWGKDMAITMAAPTGWKASNFPHRSFMPDEKCWVTAIQVQQDAVLMQLYSDPYNNIRYYASLKIPFPNKNGVQSVDSTVQSVAEVLSVASNITQDGQTIPIAGQYLLPGGSHILLLPDGSFTKFVGAWQGHGQYAVDGSDLKLTFTSTGLSENFKLQAGNLLNVDTNQVWARSADAPVAAPAPLPPATAAAPPPPVAPAALSPAPPAPMPAAPAAPSPAATTAPMPPAAPAPSPATAPAPSPVIAPPPPPADAAPPTITVGWTKVQVTTAIGQPVKAAKIGAKDIFYYKDMKVTFINGKVTDVE
ncbi:MAG: hypothetical protein ABSE51_02500 [Terracidiphilus sp.]|jgi:hypothetical protein